MGELRPEKEIGGIWGDFARLEHGKTELQILYICPRNIK